jgi:PKD repeat protein
MTTSINQLRMNMLDMQTLNSVKTNRPTVDKLIEEQEKEENVFTKKGQDNYNEAMDYNGDGVVTYDEYMKYCEENAVSQYNSNPSVKFISVAQNTDGQVRPIHIGKALENYSHFGEEKVLPFVDTEA